MLSVRKFWDANISCRRYVIFSQDLFDIQWSVHMDPLHDPRCLDYGRLSLYLRRCPLMMILWPSLIQMTLLWWTDRIASYTCWYIALASLRPWSSVQAEFHHCCLVTVDTLWVLYNPPENGISYQSTRIEDCHCILECYIINNRPPLGKEIDGICIVIVYDPLSLKWHS
jgi:hypothetical protein